MKTLFICKYTHSYSLPETRLATLIKYFKKNNYTVEAVNHAIDELFSMNLSMLSQNSKKAALEHSWEHQEEKTKEAYRNLV
jgi:hypothetical protein